MKPDNKIYNIMNKEDLAEVHKLLFDGEDLLSNDHTNAANSIAIDNRETYEIEGEDEDTLDEEEIEVREDDSDTDQSDSGDSLDEDEQGDSDSYLCTKKKGRKIIDSMEWRTTPYSSGRRTAKQNLLTRLPGVIGPAKNITGVSETWTKLIDENMLQSIVRFTNQYIETVQPRYSRERDASLIDLTELKAFLGLLYIAGTYKAGRLNLEDLWDTDGFGIEIFRLTMSLKRFRFIFQCLRFDDRNTRLERRVTDRLAPIREFFGHFVSNCQICYSPSEYMTLDEKLEAFRGRCPFIQYIPSKPAKYGIKIFALVDAKMYYTYNLEIYAGKQPEGPFEVSNKSIDVVYRMVSPIKNSGRNVTADNWFSDVCLLKSLAENYRLSYLGTIKKNKWQIPTELKNIKTRPVFSSMFAFRKEGTIVSYVPKNKNNKKNVLAISSMHFSGEIDEETGEKKKPELITMYNHTKVGVDVVDKMCSAYNVSRNTRRWPMVVFFSILNIAGINSQVIYLGNKNETLPRRLFLRRLGRKLLEEFLQRRATLSCLPLLMSTRIKEIVKFSDTSNIRKTNDDSTNDNSTNDDSTESTQKRKRCTPCQKEKKTRLTKYCCQSCGKHLCLSHSAFICHGGCKNELL